MKAWQPSMLPFSKDTSSSPIDWNTKEKWWDMLRPDNNIASFRYNRYNVYALYQFFFKQICILVSQHLGHRFFLQSNQIQIESRSEYKWKEKISTNFWDVGIRIFLTPPTKNVSISIYLRNSINELCCLSLVACCTSINKNVQN